jgi:hypothetical protein
MEPVQILPSKSEVRNGSLRRRVSYPGDPAIAFTELNITGG